MTAKIKYLLLLLTMQFLFSIVSASEFERVSCLIHIHSSYSMSTIPPLWETALEARKRNIDVIIPTDHAIRRWEYGLRPFENIVKKTFNESSVIKMTPEKYLAELHKIEIDNPGLLVIPGVEAAAFYYWTGNPFKDGLVMNNWHKHMLIVGLENPQDYYGLPLVSNNKAEKYNILLFWPIFLLIPGMLVSNKTIFRLIIFFCLLFLIYNYPFKKLDFNQYSGDMGDKPYQVLIDYANSKGLLSFWAHPEAPNFKETVKIGPASIVTKPYPESILNTVNYTGFALYAEGYKIDGAPAGYWDRTLMEYCSGKREKPVWAIGERDYSGDKNMIATILNYIWVKDKTKTSVLDGLKNGRFYTVESTPVWGLILNDFYISNGKSNAVCGQEIDSTDNKTHQIKVSLIKNAKVIRIFEAATPVQISYDDTSEFETGRNYYRILVEGVEACHIALNPVFVKR
jgi:hypothetical protein